jgi:putative lipoprotein
MPVARVLLFATLPLFAACQMFASPADSDGPPPVRLQGELQQVDGALRFTPCNEQRSLEVLDAVELGLAEDMAMLGDGRGAVFADLAGRTAQADSEWAVEQLYRLEPESRGCADPDFRQLVLSASGNEPGWQVRINRKGLVLNRPEQPPLALPYLEEQLPAGGIAISSEANGQRLDLWVAPQRCVDSMSGAVRHLTAELRVDGQVQRGCAYFGGARSQ